MAINYRKKVFDFCKANNLTILNAGPETIDIDYPPHVRCVTNNFHGLYYPSLKSEDVKMPQAWKSVWEDLEEGVEPCPKDCDCYV